MTTTPQAPRWMRLATRLWGLDPALADEAQRFRRAIAQAAAIDSVVVQPDADTSPTRPLAMIGARLGRVATWQRLADTARQQGDELLGAVYDLRVMRLRGTDRHGRLPRVTTLLHKQGFDHVVPAVQAMYAPNLGRARTQTQRDILDAAPSACRDNPPADFEVVDDRRGEATHRVAVIVSMYNAHDKMPIFWDRLCEQTLTQAGGVELILVDSQSPGDEGAVFRQKMAERPLPALYLRTRDRETIQQAWNRGLAMRRAPLVTLLGVDEGVRPEGLARLADYLDAHPEVDWVQADSVVLEVEPSGRVLRELRRYHSEHFDPHVVHLHHQYLLYVGAMYRAAMHERVGYFDPRFRAAGDTEFKYRSLPHVRVAALPELLGEYLNYPDERATEHPRAELEDYPAFELHHSRAGAGYRLQHAGPDEVAHAARIALGQARHNTFGHAMTNLDYAIHIARWAADQPFARELPSWLTQPDRLDTLHAAYHALDELPPNAGRLASLARLWHTMRTTASTMRHVRHHDPAGFQPTCLVFNDARYDRWVRTWS